MKGKNQRVRRSPEATIVLMELREKVRAGKPLSASDREVLALLLDDIHDGRDPCARFWKTVPHRQTDKIAAALAFFAAEIVALEKAKGVKLAKVRKSIAQQKTGLTAGQVDHAIRRYGDLARERVALHAYDLDGFERWIDECIADLRGK